MGIQKPYSFQDSTEKLTPEQESLAWGIFKKSKVVVEQMVQQGVLFVADVKRVDGRHVEVTFTPEILDSVAELKVIQLDTEQRAYKLLEEQLERQKIEWGRRTISLLKEVQAYIPSLSEKSPTRSGLEKTITILNGASPSINEWHTIKHAISNTGNQVLISLYSDLEKRFYSPQQTELAPRNIEDIVQAYSEKITIVVPVVKERVETQREKKASFTESAYALLASQETLQTARDTIASGSFGTTRDNPLGIFVFHGDINSARDIIDRMKLDTEVNFSILNPNSENFFDKSYDGGFATHCVLMELIQFAVVQWQIEKDMQKFLSFLGMIEEYYAAWKSVEQKFKSHFCNLLDFPLIDIFPIIRDPNNYTKKQIIDSMQSIRQRSLRKIPPTQKERTRNTFDVISAWLKDFILHIQSPSKNSCPRSLFSEIRGPEIFPSFITNTDYDSSEKSFLVDRMASDRSSLISDMLNGRIKLKDARKYPS